MHVLYVLLLGNKTQELMYSYTINYSRLVILLMPGTPLASRARIHTHTAGIFVSPKLYIFLLILSLFFCFFFFFTCYTAWPWITHAHSLTHLAGCGILLSCTHFHTHTPGLRQNDPHNPANSFDLIEQPLCHTNLTIPKVFPSK